MCTGSKQVLKFNQHYDFDDKLSVHVEQKGKKERERRNNMTKEPRNHTKL